MRRLIVVLGMLLAVWMPAKAQDVGDLIKATLLDHVVASSIYGFRTQDQGPAKLILSDSIVRLGSYEGSSIMDLQAGFYGSTQDVDGEAQVANWIFGAELRVDPFLRSRIPLMSHWEFLKAIEHGPAAFYDATNSKWIVGYQVGMSFKLNPNLP